jgi:hypothetical protein
MLTRLLRDGDDARFVLLDVDPDLHASAAELLAHCGEGFERRAAWRGEVEATFERFAASIETMLRQHAGLEPMPWGPALRRFAALVGDDAAWYLVGSGALAVRGIPVAPRDIDLVVAEGDFPEVVRRLGDHLVEPVSESADWIARWFCRAFLGGRVECVAGVPDWVDAPEASDFGPVAWSRRERISWCGLEVAVPPLDLQLAVSRRRGLTERARLIERAIGVLDHRAGSRSTTERGEP